ncbi:late competence protein [Gracilibacillus halophilus YIM-C55.5]|uniref:Late competence protein n=1 Tax=Gracilibacillus halophilus YIM-C55.5 TaxID=1308866 RepID=N4WT65_9BACI|nr:DNA internalization-related competence protein ComEC/Rec2 [Gracilibacillus halophilus]ENH97530.1 late competence protein [Gracilibacillus halophilus YIM-C55.5]
MAGKLHWIVLAIITGYLAKRMDIPILIVVFFPWLVVLYIQKRITAPFFGCIALCCIVSFFEFPATSLSYDVTSKESLSVQGKITSEVDRGNERIHFLFREASTDQLMNVVYFPNDSVDKTHINDWKTGAQCDLFGQFSNLPTQTNPGEFDYQQFLASRGVVTEFQITDLGENHCVGNNMLHHVYQIKQQMRHHIGEKVGDFTEAWIAALLFGDRDQLSDDVIQLFERWHLSHLLAISGLHVGLFITCLYFFLVIGCRITKETVQWILIGFLLIYPLLAGAAPSVWRASLLVLLFIILRKIKWSYTSTDGLSAIFIVMVVVDSTLLDSLAFQFSFFVTYAILLSKRWLLTDSNYIWSSLRVSLLCFLVVIPLQLFHYYQIQPLSILLNLFVIPYFSIVVIPGLLAIAVSTLLPLGTSYLTAIFQWIHTFALSMIESVDVHVDVTWIIGKVSLLFFLLYFLLFVVFMIFMEKRKTKQAFVCAILFVGLLISESLGPYFDHEGQMTMLHIGQGDALVIELPYRKGVFMIDAGGSFGNDFTTPSDQVFQNVIDPFLKSRGIARIDAIFLTHADHDHIGSVPYLMANYPVTSVITSPYFEKDLLRTYRNINANVKYVQVRQGDQLNVANQSFLVLHPGIDMDSKNENSLVLKSKFGSYEWLFTGDIEAASEASLIEDNVPLDSDILKVAHHGSQTSSTQDFLEEVRPQIGLISVGEKNRYNHPNPEVLARFEENAIPIYRTDQSGAIIYRFSQENGTLYPFLPYNKVK